MIEPIGWIPRLRYPYRDLLRTLKRAQRTSPRDSAPFSLQHIEYILETGANWAGPIGDFHLVVDKGNARNLVTSAVMG